MTTENENPFKLAVSLIRSSELKTARRLLQEIVEKKEDDEQTWVWLAVTYTSDETRMRILQYALRRYPESALLQRSLLTMQQKIEQKLIGSENIEETALPPLAEQSISEREPTAATTPESSAQPVETQTENNNHMLLLAVGIILITVIVAFVWAQFH